MTAPRTRPPALRYALAPTLLVGLALAGCGGGTSSTSAAASSAVPTPQASRGAGQMRVPGTSGLVAAVTGSTAQVQATDSQTAVSWTPTTTFTETVAGTAADVVVGSCVVVRSAAPAGGAATTPSAAPTRPTEVTATAVTLSPAVDGACTGGPGGFGGGPGAPGGPGGVRPSGLPDPSASPGARGRGGPGGFGGGSGGAFGTVTAVSATGFTVQSSLPPDTGAAPGGTPPTTTVTSSPGTTYTRTVPATAAAVQVGVCLTAIGQPDSTGAVTATRITLRPAVDGVCTAGRRGAGAGA